MTADYIDQFTKLNYRPDLSADEFKTAIRQAIADSLASAARAINRRATMQAPGSYERRLLLGLSQSIRMQAQKTTNVSCAKLDARAAKEIRRLRKIGVKVADIAEQFEVSTTAVYRVLSGESWGKK